MKKHIQRNYILTDMKPKSICNHKNELEESRILLWKEVGLDGAGRGFAKGGGILHENYF